MKEAKKETHCVGRSVEIKCACLVEEKNEFP